MWGIGGSGKDGGRSMWVSARDWREREERRGSMEGLNGKYGKEIEWSGRERGSDMWISGREWKEREGMRRGSLERINGKYDMMEGSGRERGINTWMNTRKWKEKGGIGEGNGQYKTWRDMERTNGGYGMEIEGSRRERRSNTWITESEWKERERMRDRRQYNDWRNMNRKRKHGEEWEGME